MRKLLDWGHFVFDWLVYFAIILVLVYAVVVVGSFLLKALFTVLLMGVLWFGIVSIVIVHR